MSNPKRRWTGQALEDLLTLKPAEIAKKYGVTKNYAKTQKYRVKKQIQERIDMEQPTGYEAAGNNEAEKLDAIKRLLERSGVDFNEVDRVTRVNVWQGFIKNAEGEIETVDLTSAQFIPRQSADTEQFLSQADPVRITPSRRKPAKRDHKLYVAFGDNQIDYRFYDGEFHPTHDERVISITRLICQDLQPDVIVNLGDTIDLAALSRFAPDSNHFNHSMKPSFNRVHRMYAELRADNPSSRIVEVDSNHNTRLTKFVAKNFPQMYGVTRAGAEQDEYPVLTYPFLTNLNAVQVEWISGYGAAELVLGDEPPIVFKHGNIASNVPGSTMAKEAKANPEVNIVRAHGHSMEQVYRTNRAGRYLGYIMVGASCRTTGEVPSFHSAVDDRGRPVHYQENWQQSILVVEDYGDGFYNFQQVPIQQGKAYYRGKLYAAEETEL